MQQAECRDKNEGAKVLLAKSRRFAREARQV